MSFENVESLYSNTQGSVDFSIDNIFFVMSAAVGGFESIITIVASIYIALMGYGILSGYIVVSTKEAAVRFSKVALILILSNFFTTYAGDLYTAVWTVPEAIGNFLASSFADGTLDDGNFDTLMDKHAIAATEIGQKYAQGHDVDQQGLAIGTWAIAMAPIFVLNITIILAKVISAVLFLVSPVVFILSLLGVQNNYLSAWFKALLLTFLTVIIVYIVGVLVLDIVREQLIALRDLPYDKGKPVSIAAFAPLGVLSVFGVVVISQATTIASSIIGAAAINTQQATGFMQIAALQGANKLGKPS